MINCKFAVGEKVIFLMENLINKATIKRIDICVDKSATEIKYWVDFNPLRTNYTTCFGEDKLFATKQELLDSL